MSINRRDILTGIAVGTPAILLAANNKNAFAETAAAGAGGGSAFAGKHAVAPLPFDPKKLSGISEKMIVSHHDNNYAGAVKNLNKVEEQLASVTKDTPPFVVTGLKERELTFTNSAILHQHYFANLGGNGKASGAIEKQLAASYGSLARWEENFRAVGNSLGGGSGWAILDFNFQTGDVRTYWSGGHTQSPAFAAPLLIMDMYEHAYAIDYGSAAGKYIDAFFKNINWDEVNHRLERAEKAGAALHG
ncbi:MAG: superoxide dismutase, Fe-Mn family [Myxococcales bacterium]|jgi:Fe-Mn family superoxide dismutase|nr:superoxide dismutase, Fe-Mn family [Myxococcales bacterium]